VDRRRHALWRRIHIRAGDQGFQEEPMSADSSTGAGDLQFDRAIIPDAAPSTGGPVCAKCNASIRMYYYHVDGDTTCSSCKQALERANGGGIAAGRSGGRLKAVFAGLGAAVAGSIIYYSVMKYLDLEIGYVAILIGFMVGYAIRGATAGRGSRRLQVLAAGLTYFAVALAYLPFSIEGMREAAKEGVSADSVTASLPSESLVASTDATAPAGDAQDTRTDASIDAADAAASSDLGIVGLLLGLGGGVLFVLALPLVVIFGSMPGGLISALIIGIGMHQAWKMTAPIQLAITGPFKVGSDGAPATA
jgi:hypothetical protein